MRKMKDSGLDIVGYIPSEWDFIRLRYLCDITTGDSDTQDADPDGEYPFYVRSPIVERSTKFTFNGEGILMAGDGAGAGRVFHHAFGKYAVHQRVYRLYNFKVNSNFLFYYISNLFPSVMDKGSAQSTVPSVRLPMLLNFEVCTPPLAEQQRIADFLDEKCGEIDSIRSDIQKQIDILNDYKKSVITEAVTKGLDPRAKLKDSGIEWIGKIPEGWNVFRIKYLATEPNTLFTDGDWINGDIITEDGIRYLTSGNVGEGKFKYQGEGHISLETFNEKHCLKAVPGDLMICRLNLPIGRCCFIPDDEPFYVIAVDNVILRPNSNVDKKYAMYCMNTPGYAMDAEMAAGGTTMKRISRTDLGNLRIPVPPLSEQKAIADYLDEKCSEIDATIADKQRQLETLDEYKKSLIFEYVTGKKEVPA